MIFYPTALPCVSRLEGVPTTAFAGVVRTPMEAGNARQRRVHRVLPHQIGLAWDIEQGQLAAWVAWVNAYAWDQWVLVALPGVLASREGVHAALTPVRFISDLSQELLQGHGLWFWRVRVTAEWQPTPEDLALVPLSNWISAGTPTEPAPDWIIAGTPDNPSPWLTGFGP